MKKRILPLLFVFVCMIPCLVRAQDAEVSLWLCRLINQARIRPMEIVRALDIDEAAARAALGSDQQILDQGLPPFAWNSFLARAATNHGNDMIDNLYYSSTGLDNSTVADRIAAVGYGAASSGETLGITAFTGYVEPLEAAQIILENWVRDELDPARICDRRIFNPRFTEMGVSLKGAVLNLWADIPPNIYVAVADFAKPFEQRVYLLGNVYRDLNGDGVMSPEEGMPDMQVKVSSFLMGTKEVVVSQELGMYMYQALSFQGFFTVEVSNSDGLVILERAGFGDGKNCWMDLGTHN